MQPFLEEEAKRLELAGSKRRLQKVLEGKEKKVARTEGGEPKREGNTPPPPDGRMGCSMSGCIRTTTRRAYTGRTRRRGNNPSCSLRCG